jgi:hypothetical protein
VVNKALYEWKMVATFAADNTGWSDLTARDLNIVSARTLSLEGILNTTTDEENTTLSGTSRLPYTLRGV